MDRLAHNGFRDDLSSRSKIRLSGDFPAFLREKSPRRSGTPSAAPQSVPAAVYAATAHGTFEEAVTFAVACGGDTDTIAAMAGAVSGAHLGADVIPARWLDALEGGHRGRRHVEELAERLHTRGATG